MSFLFNRVIFMFHVKFQGCRWNFREISHGSGRWYGQLSMIGFIGSLPDFLGPADQMKAMTLQDVEGGGGWKNVSCVKLLLWL